MAVIAIFAIVLGIMPTALAAACVSVLLGGYFYLFWNIASGPRLPLRFSHSAGIEKNVPGKLEGDNPEFDELWNLSGEKPAAGAVTIDDNCKSLPGDLTRLNRASRDRSERVRIRRRGRY